MVSKQGFKRLSLTLVAILYVTLSLTTTVYGEESISKSQKELDKVNQIATIKDMDDDTTESYLMGLIAIEEPTETDEQALSVAFETVLNTDSGVLYSDDDIAQLKNYDEKINQSAYSSKVKKQIIDQKNVAIETIQFNQNSEMKTLLLFIVGSILLYVFLIILWGRRRYA